MKATVTFFPSPLDKTPDFQVSGDHEILACRIAKFFAAQSKAYKSFQGIVLNTIGIHARPDMLGIRFYHSTPSAHNPRHALNAEFNLSVKEIATSVDKEGIVRFCNSLADAAIDQIKQQF